MQPQRGPSEDLTQPCNVERPNIRHTTDTTIESGRLAARSGIPNSLDISLKQEGFKGGPDICPDITVEGPGGEKRPANQRDFGERPFQAPGTEESEQASSIVPVCDLGFSAVPTMSLHQFHHFRSCSETSQPSPEVEHFMSPDELQRHLGCEGGVADSVQQVIADKMEENFERSQQSGEDYLPLDAFEEIFNIETIKSLVKEIYPTSSKSLWVERVARIVGTEPGEGYRRILGILVLMGQLSYITDFIEEDVKDSDLPIRKSHGGGKEFKTCQSAPNTTLCSKWDRNSIKLFYVYQAMLFVPFFDIQDDKLRSYEFESSITLPWRNCTQKIHGGSGLVHKVQIHPKHHSFKISSNPDKPLYFALKEISADRDTYGRELWALQKSTYRTQKEKHLIRLLLTFKHGDKRYFLFEWADGNLADLWEKVKVTPTLSDAWAVQQCLGISSAIKRIHGLATWQKNQRSLGSTSDERGWGRHGDIKPDNILWFSAYENEANGILHHHLVVSDLGLTRYHSRATRSAVHYFHIEGYTWTYRPPEMERDHVVSQKYDIWSLGCVFLEFCVWYVEGGDAIETFQMGRVVQDMSEIEGLEEDKFFNVTTDDHGAKEASLKPIVEEYIERLRSANRRDAFVSQMVDLIQEGMLVVEPKKRWKIDQVCTEIARIKGALEPITELTHAVDAALTVTTHETSSEDRPLMELDMSQIDTLVHHAQGNSEEVLARQPTLSIRSESDDLESQSAANESHLASAEPKDDEILQETNSTEKQVTLSILGNSHPHISAPASPTPKTTIPMRSLVHVDAGKLKATETQEIASINTGSIGGPSVMTLDNEASGVNSEQPWRKHLKLHVSRVSKQWTVLRNKVEKYTQKTLQSQRQVRKTNKSKTI